MRMWRLIQAGGQCSNYELWPDSHEYDLMIQLYHSIRKSHSQNPVLFVFHLDKDAQSRHGCWQQFLRKRHSWLYRRKSVKTSVASFPSFKLFDWPTARSHWRKQSLYEKFFVQSFWWRIKWIALAKFLAIFSVGATSTVKHLGAR